MAHLSTEDFGFHVERLALIWQTSDEMACSVEVAHQLFDTYGHFEAHYSLYELEQILIVDIKLLTISGMPERGLSNHSECYSARFEGNTIKQRRSLHPNIYQPHMSNISQTSTPYRWWWDLGVSGIYNWQMSHKRCQHCLSVKNSSKSAAPNFTTNHIPIWSIARYRCIPFSTPGIRLKSYCQHLAEYQEWTFGRRNEDKYKDQAIHANHSGQITPSSQTFTQLQACLNQFGPWPSNQLR